MNEITAQEKRVRDWLDEMTQKRINFSHKDILAAKEIPETGVWFIEKVQKVVRTWVAQKDSNILWVTGIRESPV